MAELKALWLAKQRIHPWQAFTKPPLLRFSLARVDLQRSGHNRCRALMGSSSLCVWELCQKERLKKSHEGMKANSERRGFFFPSFTAKNRRNESRTGEGAAASHCATPTDDWHFDPESPRVLVPLKLRWFFCGLISRWRGGSGGFACLVFRPTRPIGNWLVAFLKIRCQIPVWFLCLLDIWSRRQRNHQRRFRLLQISLNSETLTV